jgi:hypothetical protein
MLGASILANITIDGAPRKVILHAKNGFLLRRRRSYQRQLHLGEELRRCELRDRLGCKHVSLERHGCAERRGRQVAPPVVKSNSRPKQIISRTMPAQIRRAMPSAIRVRTRSIAPVILLASPASLGSAATFHSRRRSDEGSRVGRLFGPLRDNGIQECAVDAAANGTGASLPLPVRTSMVAHFTRRWAWCSAAGSSCRCFSPTDWHQRHSRPRRSQSKFYAPSTRDVRALDEPST